MEMIDEKNLDGRLERVEAALSSAWCAILAGFVNGLLRRRADFAGVADFVPF
jgi:hypothetical protein